MTEPAGGPARDDDKVCVVAAGSAWPFYRLTGAYVCPPGRTFRPDIGRLGFYSSRLIHGAAARILSIWPVVRCDEASIAELALSTHPTYRRLGNVLAAHSQHYANEREAQVILLSPMADPSTIAFPPIRHEGQTAWTMSKRYISLELLRRATTTRELESAPTQESNV